MKVRFSVRDKARDQARAYIENGLHELSCATTVVLASRALWKIADCVSAANELGCWGSLNWRARFFPFSRQGVLPLVRLGMSKEAAKMVRDRLRQWNFILR